MKKTLIILGIIAIYSCGIVTGYFIFKPKNPSPVDGEYYAKKDFVPDTVFLPGAYIEVPVKGEQIKPKTIIIQKSDNPQKNFNFSTGSNDATPAFVISNTDTSFHLNPGNTFFTGTNKWTYCDTTQLFYGEFSRDTLRLRYKHAGNVEDKVYITDYSKHKYQLRNNVINISDIPTSDAIKITPKRSLIQYDGTFINGSNDFNSKTYSAGAEIGVRIGRIKIQGFGNIPVIKPTIQTQALNQNYGFRVGYKLF